MIANCNWEHQPAVSVGRGSVHWYSLRAVSLYIYIYLCMCVWPAVVTVATDWCCDYESVFDTTSLNDDHVGHRSVSKTSMTYSWHRHSSPDDQCNMLNSRWQTGRKAQHRDRQTDSIHRVTETDRQTEWGVVTVPCSCQPWWRCPPSLVSYRCNRTWSDQPRRSSAGTFPYV